MALMYSHTHTRTHTHTHTSLHTNKHAQIHRWMMSKYGIEQQHHDLLNICKSRRSLVKLKHFRKLLDKLFKVSAAAN